MDKEPKNEKSVAVRATPVPRPVPSYAQLTAEDMGSYAGDFCTPYTLVGISGIICAGKTTLCRKLAALLGWAVLEEPVGATGAGNRYLPLYYSNPPESYLKYGFVMQIYLLDQRFRLHEKMLWGTSSVLMDRTIFEDVIFARMLWKKGLITDLDYQTYKGIYHDMTKFTQGPDVFLFLDVTPEEAHRRLVSRMEKDAGRKCECTVTVEYLSDLRDGYEEWIRLVSKTKPVVHLVPEPLPEQTDTGEMKYSMNIDGAKRVVSIADLADMLRSYKKTNLGM